MQLSTLAFLAAAATTSLAADLYAWQITNWSAGGTRGGNYYDFNITASALHDRLGDVPAFHAACSGYQPWVGENVTLAYTMTPCTLLGDSPPAYLDLAAKLLPLWDPNLGVPPRIMAIRMDYGNDTYSRTRYVATTNVTYNQFVAPAMDFTLYPAYA